MHFARLSSSIDPTLSYPTGIGPETTPAVPRSNIARLRNSAEIIVRRWGGTIAAHHKAASSIRSNVTDGF